MEFCSLKLYVLLTATFLMWRK